jgi:DNA-binding transcriptional ArsR family regulator
VSDERPKKVSVEVSSQSLQDELVAIKDRLSAIETIASISNAAVVRKYVEDHLKTDKGKAIMKECEEPRTKNHLISQFKFNSPQALDHHLKPLLKDDLVRQRVEEDGTILFEWSNLFRRLPHSTIVSILKDAK